MPPLTGWERFYHTSLGAGSITLLSCPQGAFASCSLGTAEKNYSHLEKEGLAIVFGVKKFHQFLFGRHSPSCRTISPSNISSRRPLPSFPWPPQESNDGHCYWEVMTTQSPYKPGQQPSNADILSRLPTSDAPSSTPVPPETIGLLEQLHGGVWGILSVRCGRTPMTTISVIDWTTLVHEYEHLNVTTVIISHLPYIVKHKQVWLPVFEQYCSHNWTPLLVMSPCIHAMKWR